MDDAISACAVASYLQACMQRDEDAAGALKNAAWWADVACREKKVVSFFEQSFAADLMKKTITSEPSWRGMSYIKQDEHQSLVKKHSRLLMLGAHCKTLESNDERVVCEQEYNAMHSSLYHKPHSTK